MTSTRVSLIATSAAVALWALKGLAIGAAGGLGRSPFEGPLFLAGLLSFVVAAVALGVAALPGRGRGIRALAGLGTLLAGVAVAAGVDALVSTFQPADADRHWARTEVNLWAVAVLALLLALWLNRGRANRTNEHPVAVPAA